MPRTRKQSAGDSEQLALLQARTKTAPAVPAIRLAVDKWRDDGYAGATEVSNLLLNFWFRADHRLHDGSAFVYHDSQREAIETLIFIYEAAKKRTLKDLLEAYAQDLSEQIRLLQFDDFPRYAIKMATGSGKTKVMSLAM